MPEILRVEPTDEKLIQACHTVQVAASAVDDPYLPPMSYPMFATLIGAGWTGDPRETWLTADGTGWLSLELPEHENKHLAMLELAVQPTRRRRGTGTALLSFASKRCVALGRSTISTGAWIGSPGEEFIRRYGTPGINEVRRVLRVGEIPAVELAAGYSLVSWMGAVPADRLGQVAGINRMLADAPRDASWDAEVWDDERVRRTDRRIETQGLRYYSIAVLADSGEMAALSQLGVDPERPGWGFQELTAVAREHRGHGLGLAVKAAMLAWLSSAEPGVEQIMTWNAEQNKHMIAINEALGCEVLGVPMRSWEWELG